MDQTRLLTSAVPERKSGKWQGWCTGGRLRARHPPAGQGNASGNGGRHSVPPTPGAAPSSARRALSHTLHRARATAGEEKPPHRNLPVGSHGEEHAEGREAPTRPCCEGGWGCSGSSGVRTRMKESPNWLRLLKGWLQVSRRRSHFCPTASARKSAAGGGQQLGWRGHTGDRCPGTAVPAPLSPAPLPPLLVTLCHCSPSRTRTG